MTPEILVAIIFGIVSNLLIIGAGYATLRERIKSNEIHTLYIRQAIEKITNDIQDIMRKMNLQPRAREARK